MFKRGSKAPHQRVIVKSQTWRRVPMRLLKWRRKMPSTQQYNLVPNDEYDTRIPLHPEEAFQYGITFHAKYIGTMDVPRPTNRVEIVAAMRRVRYEFKAKGIKKRKVTVDVSTEGVRVTTRKKKSSSKSPSAMLFGRSNKYTSSENTEIMHHPIYRIFYVSHDSSDLKIFSYIARDGATNVFKCNVFKSNRKSQAMRIVRTVGQAFEVCHKMQNNGPEQPAPSTSSAVDDQALTDRASEILPTKEAASDCSASESGAAFAAKPVIDEVVANVEEVTKPKELELLPPPPRKEGKRSPQLKTAAPSISLPELPECVTKVELTNTEEDDNAMPLSRQHHLQLLKERLEQQAQQTRAAVAQLLLVRDQLAAEQAARCEAQARTHQLLVHNKELLEHIAALVAHLQDRECGVSKPISAQQVTLLPQKKKDGASEDLFSFENGNNRNFNDSLIHLVMQNKITSNLENNNARLSSITTTPNIPGSPVGGSNTAPTFEGMTIDQIQAYLTTKFQNMEVQNRANTTAIANIDDQMFRNNNVFPNMSTLANSIVHSDNKGNIINNQAYIDIKCSKEYGFPDQSINVSQSEISLNSTGQGFDSMDSSPEEVSSETSASFIRPLSHNGVLRTTGEDGRIRLIVPVSPSSSSTDVPTLDIERQPASGMSLNVPEASRMLNPAGPITRTTSEKVPNRSEMMAALRSQWTRHTTK